MEQKTVHRKELKGTVVSAKMTDTAVVSVMRYVKHPKYKKYLKRSKRYLADNKGNRAKEGDVVTIRSCRPLSKNKSFEIVFSSLDTASDK